MPFRLPVVDDLPPSLGAVITPSPSSQSSPVNVVIFLHGLGDTATSFAAFPKALDLPETLCITLQAPTPLPFDLGGFHWGDDVLFDQASGEMDFDAGFEKASKLLRETMKVLMEKCGYKGKEILMFGFGQGAMAALATARSIPDELGGIISIGGPMPGSSPDTQHDTLPQSNTPVLVLGGSSQSLVGKQDIMARFKTAFKNLQYHKWNKVGDSMPRNRDEVLPIMQFFSRRLRSRKGVPEASIEIG